MICMGLSIAIILAILYACKYAPEMDDNGNYIKRVVPIIHQCSWCKKWMHGGKLHDKQPVEASIVSHGICPNCAKGFLESVNTTP